MKYLYIVPLFSILIVGCGSSSDNPGIKYLAPDDSRYLCPAQKDVDNCVDGDCSTCKLLTPTKEKDTELEACKIEGNAIVADEGKACNPGGQFDKLECEDDRVTLDNFLNAKTINLNGKTYKCSSNTK